MIENESSGPALPTGRRGRKPHSLGASVTVLLILIGGAAGCGNAPALTAASAPSTPTTAASTTTAAPTTTTAAPTTTPAPTSSVAPSATVGQLGIAAVPNRRAPTTPPEQPAPKPAPKPAPEPAPEPSVYYKNCDAVRAAGAAPIRAGDPGYRSALDRDGDGQGCGAD